MRLVVIPQGIRRVLPALVNQFISLLKASSLVYFLGLIAGQRELFQVGRDLNAQTGNLSPLVAAGALLPGADDPADPPGQLHRQPAATRQAGHAESAIRGPADRQPGDHVTDRSQWSSGGPATFTCRFGQHAVLRGVDIERRPPAHTAAVIGPSGSGKSTLLRTLNRLLRARPAATSCSTAGRCLTDDPDAAAAADRHGVPAFQPVPAPDACSTTSCWRRASSSASSE